MAERQGFLVTASSRHKASEQAQDDPGESNDPRPAQSSYDIHIWQTLNDVLQSLGKIDQKVDQLSIDQKELKNSVEKHDKVIMRVGFGIAGAVVVIGALWFIYDNFLKDRITFT